MMPTEKQKYVMETKFIEKCEKAGYKLLTYGTSGIITIPIKYTYKDGPSFEGIETITLFSDPETSELRSFKHYKAGYAGWSNLALDLDELKALKEFTEKNIYPRMKIAAKISR